MSTQVLTATKIYAGEYDVTGQVNQVSLDYDAEALPDTTFGSGGTKTHKGGLKTVKFSMGGFVDEGTGLIGDFTFSRIGTVDIPLTTVPQGGSVGDIAYFFKALQAAYQRPLQVGQLYAFSLSAEASNGPLVRGQVFVAAGAKTSTGTSSVVQLGATGASQRLYAALHVLSVSGSTPTLDVTVKSDDAGGFASPATRITFAQKAAIGYELLSAAGPITDDYIRVDYTIGGSSPSFSFVVVVGIARSQT